jgi:hypothetical protein
MVLLTGKFLDVAKFTTVTRVENIFPTYFRIEITQQNFHVVPRELIKYTS